jgi:hypothetical protein
MLKNTPAIGDGIRPGCESYGYLLDGNGNCAYITSYNREVAAHPDAKNQRDGQNPSVYSHAQFQLLDLRSSDLQTERHYQ